MSLKLTSYEKHEICELVRKIRQHPEFRNLSEPGRTHEDFLIKWENVEDFTSRMGYSWFDDGPRRVSHELWRREVSDAHALWASIEDVEVKKGVRWGPQSTRTIPARPERRR